jgi:(2Fe-2S) ferredoxin
VSSDDVLVTQTGCLFPCNHAPVVLENPGDRWWGPVSAEDAQNLVDVWAGDIAAGVRRLMHKPPKQGPAS